MSRPLSTGGFRALARAKVNLALEVLHKRKDGYHEIETILQSVDLYDELSIGFDESSRISITRSTTLPSQAWVARKNCV